ncbi:glycosyltransferase [Natrialbaceae archaeon A-CW1-1]
MGEETRTGTVHGRLRGHVRSIVEFFFKESSEGNDRRHVTVLHLPHADTNPYQTNLAEAIEANDVTVSFSSGYPVDTLQTIATSGFPDILHLHWISPYLVSNNRLLGIVKSCVFTIGLLIFRLLGVRIVWTAHNLVEHERRDPSLELGMKRYLVRYVFDVVFVHCSKCRQLLLTECGISDTSNTDFVTIPHGHYRDNYQNQMDETTARSRLDLPPDAFVVLFFGQIRTYKQVPKLIDAFEQIDHATMWLVIAGSSPEKRLSSHIKSKAAQRNRLIVVPKFIPDGAVQMYMNAADVVVYPFRDIFTSGSVLLAMSFGKAIIGPRMPFLEEVVSEDGGVLYDPDAPDGLVSALRNVANKDVDQMGAINYEKTENHSWKIAASRTVQVYHDLLNVQSTPRRAPEPQSTE